eukprot:642039-Pelagomonas_calceolata.AAC.3
MFMAYLFVWQQVKFTIYEYQMTPDHSLASDHPKQLSPGTIFTPNTQHSRAQHTFKLKQGKKEAKD